VGSNRPPVIRLSEAVSPPPRVKRQHEVKNCGAWSIESRATVTFTVYVKTSLISYTPIQEDYGWILKQFMEQKQDMWFACREMLVWIPRRDRAKCITHRTPWRVTAPTNYCIFAWVRLNFVYDVIISKATRVTNEAEHGHDVIHGSQSLVNLSPYFIESLLFNRAVRAPPASPSPCHSSEPINPGLRNTIIGRAASTRSTCRGGWSHP
jgi:hypothetical protein